MTNKSTPRYVNNFGQYDTFFHLGLPTGLRATSHEGVVYEYHQDQWDVVGGAEGWDLDEDRSNAYRIDHDPLDPLATAFEYGGHIYAEGDEVEFLHEGRWIRTILRRDGNCLRSTDAWANDGYDYKPRILSTGGRLHREIDGLRMYEPEVQAGPETLHTIDCRGVDPAIIQDYLDSYIAHREAVAELEALAEKARAADERQRDLFGRHSANREALRGALDAVAQAAA